MLSRVKYLLVGCLVDALLLVLFLIRINTAPLGECGQTLAFLYVDGCTFRGFMSYGLYWGTLVLLANWWVTLPVLALPLVLGYAMDMSERDLL